MSDSRQRIDRFFEAALFDMGNVVATPNVLDKVSKDEIRTALTRHQSGDWGELTGHDAALNAEALKDGSRIMSIYSTSSGTKFWIITDAGHEVTTVLMPDDY